MGAIVELHFLHAVASKIFAYIAVCYHFVRLLLDFFWVNITLLPDLCHIDKLMQLFCCSLHFYFNIIGDRMFFNQLRDAGNA